MGYPTPHFWSNRLYLTAKADRLHASIWPIAEMTVDDALGALSPAERRTLSKLMVRVKTTLQVLAERDPVLSRPAKPGTDEREARLS